MMGINEILQIIVADDTTKADDCDVLSNYNLFVSVFNALLKIKPEAIEKTSFNIMLNKVLKITFDKIRSGQVLSEDEAIVFTSTLYNDVVNDTKLGSNIGLMQYVKPGPGSVLPADCLGLHIKRQNDLSKIYYSTELLDRICKAGDANDKGFCLMAIPHELVHALQYKEAFDGCISLNAFICSLELVVRKNSSYYSENYSFTRLENDAIARAFGFLAYFIGHRGLAEEEYCNSLYRKFINYYQDRMNETQEHCVKISGLEDKSGRVFLRKCSGYIKDDLTSLTTYPLLKMVYNSDGDVKSSGDMFGERKRLLVERPNKAREINEIYDYIFDCYFNGDELAGKLTSILQYLRDEDSRDEYAARVFVEQTAKGGASADAAKALVRKYSSVVVN